MSQAKDLSNELRKAHFHLGFQKGIPKRPSQYLYQYYEKPFDKDARNGNIAQNHWRLGNQTIQGVYQSHNHATFKPPQIGQKAGKGLSHVDNKKNIILGFEGQKLQSLYNADYPAKQADGLNKQDWLKKVQQLKKHSHEMGEDNPDYQTMYKQEMVPKQGQSFSKQQLNKQIASIRNSSIPFLHPNSGFKSHSHQVHTLKKGDPFKKAEPLQNTNIISHNQQPNKESIAKSSFTNPNNIFPERSVVDSKKTNFTMGHDRPTLLSQARHQYVQKPFDSKPQVQASDPSLQIGDGTTNQYQTSYKTQFYQKNSGKQQLIKAKEASLELLGSYKHSVPYITESKDQFNKKVIEPTKQAQPIKAQSTINLGEEMTQFTTQHRDTYHPKIPVPNQMSAENKLNLKKNHFVLGFKRPQHNPISTTYGQRLGPPNTLPKDKADQIKNHHFSLNNNDQNATTSYRAQFIDKGPNKIEISTQRAAELRNAHFKLGFQKAKDHSEYAKEFYEKPLQPPQSTYKHGQLLNLGNQYEPTIKQSHSHQIHRGTIGERSQLTDGMKKDLRGNHFVFGFQKGKSNTNYEQDYIRKFKDGIDPQQHKRKVDQLKKHSIGFGDQQNQYLTQYVNAFQAKRKDGLQQELQNQVKKQIELNKKTNIKLGNTKVSYAPTVEKAYPAYKITPQMQSKADGKPGSLVLGGDQTQFQTQTKDNYTNKGSNYDNQKIKAATMYAKRTHFNMGHQKPGFSSQAKDQFTQKQGSAALIQKRQTNIRLSDGTNQPVQSSLYKAQFQPKSVQQQAHNNNKPATISLGSDKSEFLTQGRQQFTQKAIPQRVPPPKKQISAGLVLGQEKPQFSTQHQDTYTHKNLQERLKQPADKGKQHFHYGFAKGQYNLESWHYGSSRGPANKLLPQQLNQLKGGKPFEQGPFQGDTSYRIDYSKKPKIPA